MRVFPTANKAVDYLKWKTFRQVDGQSTITLATAFDVYTKLGKPFIYYSPLHRTVKMGEFRLVSGSPRATLQGPYNLVGEGERGFGAVHWVELTEQEQREALYCPPEIEDVVCKRTSLPWVKRTPHHSSPAEARERGIVQLFYDNGETSYAIVKWFGNFAGEAHLPEELAVLAHLPLLEDLKEGRSTCFPPQGS